MSGDDTPGPSVRGPVVVGLGSTLGDDQLGWIAVDRLRLRLPSSVQAVKASGGLGLLELLDGQDQVVIVDAAAPAGRPGAIRSFVWPHCDFEECAPWSTHGPGLVEALRFAELLERLPRVVSIETVEAERLECERGLSEAVEKGLAALVESILRRFHPDEGSATGPDSVKDPARGRRERRDASSGR